MTESRQTPLPRGIWPGCGYYLLAIDDTNRLRLTDAFLRRFLQRPELAPVAESCANERALHRALLDHPRRPVNHTELAALADAEARENYGYALAFRDLLLRHASLEHAYLALARGQEPLALPPALLALLVQLIVRHAMTDAGTDSYRWRAAELLFRTQQVSVESGVVVADAGYLQRQRQAPALSVLASLIHQAGGAVADGGGRPTLDLLTADTLAHYLEHSEAHDLALSLNPGEPGLDALCRVLEQWLRHFHGVTSLITPLREIRDAHWRWHVGLDATSTALLNRLYQGATLAAEEHRRLLALFQLEFQDSRLVHRELVGHPVYLAAAMTPQHELILKPQNLLVNLPLAIVA